MEIRGTGAYIVAAGSKHPSGVAYEGQLPGVKRLPEAPPWLLKLAENSNGTEAPAVDGDIPAHQRNSTLASLAGTMRRRGFSENAIAAALTVENRDRCKPPLTENEVHRIAHSIARYKPEGDAIASLDELDALLGLANVGKHIDVVRIYGRGSNAIAHIHLDHDDRIVLDPIGKFSTINKLSAELALQAGAEPTLNAPGVLRALALLHKLADHHHNIETEDRAWELGAEYLRSAVTGDVVMDDQASRWQAFAALEASGRTDLVLADTATGIRYVRTGWFEAYVRAQTGSPPDAVSRAMCALGWTKHGAQGRIKATEPKLGGSLHWKFYCVPKDWEK
jgi:hypothetical protein